MPASSDPLSPKLLLAAYAQGIFPMAESRTGSRIRWFSPEPRAILPLDTFHVPRSLTRALAKNPFEIHRDRDFHAVIHACAEVTRPHEKGTWINEKIIKAYTELHRMGHAHSVECWQHGTLLGGLYGVQIGGAFFGESMFSLVSNASKAALVALVEHLRKQGFVLLDTQFVNPHLVQFGVAEIPRRHYLALLQHAMEQDCRF